MNTISEAIINAIDKAKENNVDLSDKAIHMGEKTFRMLLDENRAYLTYNILSDAPNETPTFFEMPIAGTFFGIPIVVNDKYPGNVVYVAGTTIDDKAFVIDTNAQGIGRLPGGETDDV